MTGDALKGMKYLLQDVRVAGRAVVEEPDLRTHGVVARSAAVVRGRSPIDSCRYQRTAFPVSLFRESVMNVLLARCAFPRQGRLRAGHQGRACSSRR